MKLDRNTKRVLLFVALLACAYLISLAFGRKDSGNAGQNPAQAGTPAVIESATDALSLAETEESVEDVTETEALSLAETEEASEEAEAAEEESEAAVSEAEEAAPESVSEAAAPEPESEASSEEPEPVELAAETTEAETVVRTTESQSSGITVREDGEYKDKEHVALYIHTYGHLPSNYITKKEANALGWPEEGNMKTVAPGKSIGGDYFGNYEGLLPKKKGRKYYECDIDFNGKSRNAKRIIFSNDGLIYYTGDHYESFELLYGGD